MGKMEESKLLWLPVGQKDRISVKWVNEINTYYTFPAESGGEGTERAHGFL